RFLAQGGGRRTAAPLAEHDADLRQARQQPSRRSGLALARHLRRRRRREAVMTIGLTALVDRYLTERRTLGFQLRSAAYSLRSLAECVGRPRQRGPLTLEVMAQWARLDSHASVDPRTWARRLKQLRSFTRWMQQFEPATEVPDDTIFGRLPERQAPHIYSQEE